jgi:hypothetical protein
MNSNSLQNRLEIMVYSSLISLMSGMNRFKGKVQHLTSLTADQTMGSVVADRQAMDLPASRSLAQSWKALEQILAAMLLWAILGFAAGFLIGMLKVG